MIISITVMLLTDCQVLKLVKGQRGPLTSHSWCFLTHGGSPLISTLLLAYLHSLFPLMEQYSDECGSRNWACISHLLHFPVLKELAAWLCVLGLHLCAINFQWTIYGWSVLLRASCVWMGSLVLSVKLGSLQLLKSLIVFYMVCGRPKCVLPRATSGKDLLSS